MIKSTLFAITLGLMGQGLTADTISDVHYSMQYEKRRQEGEALRNAIKNALTPEQIEKIAKEEQKRKEEAVEQQQSKLDRQTKMDCRLEGATFTVFAIGMALFWYVIFEGTTASITSWLRTTMQGVIEETTKDITKVIVKR